jgi:flagellar biosynthesis GTPase FlhF
LRQSESSTHEAGGAIRTFQGRTVEELIPRIQDELGADAIIVRRREGLTGGVAGFFQRPFVELEVTAGGPRVDVYDEEPPAQSPDFSLRYTSPLEPQRTRTPFYARESPSPSREPPRLSRDGHYVTEDLAALARAGATQPALEPTREPVSHPVGGVPRSTGLPDPFARMLEQAASTGLIGPPQSGARASVGSRLASPASTVEADQRSSEPHRPSRAQGKVKSNLLALGVSERFAGELLDAAAVHIRPLAPRAAFSQTVRSALTQRIPVAGPLPTRGAAVVLVGPGGGGKTSCCAALPRAYRTGSVLPASYATIVRAPGAGDLRMLLSPHIRKPIPAHTSRVTRAVQKATSDGLLVIDTPPLSAGDRSGIRKLASLLGELKPERVVLVLPATLGAVATAQLLQALRPLGANALALTHTDETDQIGVAVEAACEFGLAPEYLLKRARPGGWTIGRTDPTGLAATLVQ